MRKEIFDNWPFCDRCGECPECEELVALIVQDAIDLLKSGRTNGRKN